MSYHNSPLSPKQRLQTGSATLPSVSPPPRPPRPPQYEKHHHYDDGLEVVSPESMPAQPPLPPLPPLPLLPTEPEVLPPSDPEWTPAGSSPSEQWEKYPVDRRLQYGRSSFEAEPSSVPWWRKKRIVIGLLLVLAAAVALGAGLGVGLKTNQTSSIEPGDEVEDEEAAVCGGGVCPTILSISIHLSELYLFGRTANNTVAYRRLDAEGQWQSWIDLGSPAGGAELVSQPRAVNWVVQDKFTRLDVLTIGSADGVIYNRWKSEVEKFEDNDWVSIGDNAGTPISTCAPVGSTLNLWSTSRGNGDGNITHSWWRQKDDEEISPEGLNGISKEQGEFARTQGGQWRSLIDEASSAVHCITRKDADEWYDVAYYTNDSSVAMVASWSLSQAEWIFTDLQSGGGGSNSTWIGDPFLFNPEQDNRWDFFGIRSDNELYYARWTPDDFSGVERLGGSIVSTPTAVVVGPGKLDVVALGINGTLQHMHFDGSGWADEWEDLGIEAVSAPNARIYNGQVILAAVARNGSLMTWTRDVSTRRQWKGSLAAEDLGGEMSIDFYTNNSTTTT